MKVHLVVAHPEKESFNFALHQTAISALNEEGIEICISDLYSEKFDPTAGHSDICNFPVDESFNLAKAQRWALETSSFTKAIVDEQSKSKSCDILVLQFPLWWWSFPAILKGWIDRVLTSGFAYGKDAILTPKKVMYSITTGGANTEEEFEYYQSKINGLYQDIFGFIGWEALPAFISHGVQKISQTERVKILNDYKSHLIRQITMT